MARVLVLGGGFGGLEGANELRARLPDDDEVVVVAAADRFYMGFAKLWDLGRLRPLQDGTRPLSALEAKGIGFVNAEVTAIDPANRTVSTTAGELSADALLVALGTVPSPSQLAMVAEGSGHDLYDGQALPAIHAALDSVLKGRVVVAILGGPFKCPPAPYEAALLVDERLRARGVRDKVEVALITPQPMTIPAAGPDASRTVAESLGERGIDLLDSRKVVGLDAGPPRVVQLEGDEALDYSVLLAVAAEQAPPVLAASPLAGPSGFVEPDRATLRTAFDRVYAVGDCTTVPTATAQLPKAGVFAAAQARVAACNIAADLRGGERASYDGHGMCFLEFPGRRVALVEGNFYAEPRPDVRLTPATEENFTRKQDYEREHLQAWLG